MSFGLKVWDENGVVVLDSTKGIPKFLGSMVVSSAGSLSDQRLSGRRGWTLSRPDSSGNTRTPYRASISGDVISWSGGNGGTVIMYGVY
jgi:hypothetical protein